MPIMDTVDNEQQRSPELPDFDELLRQMQGGGGVARPKPAVVDTGAAATDQAMRTSAAPAAPATSAATAPTVDPVQQAMRTMPTGGDKALGAVTSSIKPVIPAPPANAGLGELMKQRAALSTPTDPNAVDEQGKRKYKLGVGGRLLGALANFASGMGGHGVVQDIGPGATNFKYGRDEAMRTGRLEGVSSQIADSEKLSEMNRQAYATAKTSEYHEDLAKSREATAEAQQTAADARASLAEEKAKSDRATEARKQTEDANTPAPNARPELRKGPDGKMALQVRTKGGQYIPYSPKTIDEGAMLGDPAAKALFYYQHRDREGKKDQEVNGLTASEQREFKDRTRVNDKKMDSLMGARRDAVLMKQDTKDIDSQVGALQTERDQIRTEITGNRKGGKGKGGAPSASSAPATAPSTNTGKSITRAEVQALAEKNKVPYDQAEKQFTGKGYEVK